MSTRSAIIVKMEDGKYHGIYCHHNGYAGGVGQVLQEHYQDFEKVKELIGLGDISSLEPEIGVKHDFEWRMKLYAKKKYDASGAPEVRMVNAYGRDRGEKEIEAKVGSTSAEVAERIDHSYVYVYENGIWLVDGKPLAQALKDAEEEV